MSHKADDFEQTKRPVSGPSLAASKTSFIGRLKSQDLFAQGREIEIEHAGRVYTLRLTQQNKLILTA